MKRIENEIENLQLYHQLDVFVEYKRMFNRLARGKFDRASTNNDQPKIPKKKNK